MSVSDGYLLQQVHLLKVLINDIQFQSIYIKDDLTKADLIRADARQAYEIIKELLEEIKCQ